MIPDRSVEVGANNEIVAVMQVVEHNGATGHRGVRCHQRRFWSKVPGSEVLRPETPSVFGRTVHGMDPTAQTGRAADVPSGGVELHDGTTVRMHQMHADDAAGLLRFHGTLSPETTNLRFFTVHPELSASELHRFTHVDHRDREAIVATVAEEIVGVARFDRLDDPLDAEVAFVVADSWQGLGLGGALFDRLAERAREVGIARFVADILPHNRRMQSVFRHSGRPVTSSFRDGVVHVVIDLAGPAVTPGVPQVTMTEATAK